MKLITLTTALAAILAGPLAAQEVTVRVAYENNPGEPVDLVMNRWAELVTEASGGTSRWSCSRRPSWAPSRT